MSKNKFLVVYMLCILLVGISFYIILKPQPIQIMFSPISDKHINYLEYYGWHIDKKISEKQFLVHEYSNIEHLIANGIDLSPYLNGTPVRKTTYLLEEKEFSDNKSRNIYMTVYEYQANIVGVLGRIEDYDPGIIHVDGKALLQSEDRLK